MIEIENIDDIIVTEECGFFKVYNTLGGLELSTLDRGMALAKAQSLREKRRSMEGSDEDE